MSYLELDCNYKGGINKNQFIVIYENESQKNFLFPFFFFFLHFFDPLFSSKMSPSTPAIPPINESKMKLYEMFAQKQIAPPPNLSHPGVASSSPSNNSKHCKSFDILVLY
jgi:hypothetical protein